MYFGLQCIVVYTLHFPGTLTHYLGYKNNRNPIKLTLEFAYPSSGSVHQIICSVLTLFLILVHGKFGLQVTLEILQCKLQIALWFTHSPF